MEEKYEIIVGAHEKAKIEFVRTTCKYLNTFMPLSDEDEEENLLTILGLLGFEHRRKYGNRSKMQQLQENAKEG